MHIEGACHCGEITFRAEVDPNQVIICHCSDCQVLTGSPYRSLVPALEGTFKLTSGSPKNYLRIADYGVERAQTFCPECGTPIYGAPANDVELKCVGIRVGSIKQKHQLTPNKQIWCRSALNWVQDLSDLPKSDGQ